MFEIQAKRQMLPVGFTVKPNVLGVIYSVHIALKDPCLGVFVDE